MLLTGKATTSYKKLPKAWKKHSRQFEYIIPQLRKFFAATVLIL